MRDGRPSTSESYDLPSLPDPCSVLETRLRVISRTMLNSSVSSDTVAETREPDRLSRQSVIRRPTCLSSDVMAHLFSIMVTETNDVERTDRYRPGTSIWKNICG